MSAIDIPSTPAGTQLAAWLQAFNSNSETTLREYHERACPFPTNDRDDDNDNYNDNIANDLSFRSRTGGFDPHQIITSEPSKISVIIQQKADSTKQSKVVMEVKPEEPYFILRLTIHPHPMEGKGEESEEGITSTELGDGANAIRGNGPA
jgi:hypothetical protein